MSALLPRHYHRRNIAEWGGFVSVLSGRRLRRRWLWVLVTLVAVGAVAFTTLRTTAIYTSTITVVTRPASSQALIEVATSRPVAQDIIDELHLRLSPATVLGMMSITNPTNTGSLHLSVSGPDPTQTQQIATAWARQFTQAIDRIDQPSSTASVSAVGQASPPTRSGRSISLAW